jgi:hypothetical protein
MAEVVEMSATLPPPVAWWECWVVNRLPGVVADLAHPWRLWEEWTVQKQLLM